MSLKSYGMTTQGALDALRDEYHEHLNEAARLSAMIQALTTGFGKSDAALSERERTATPDFADGNWHEYDGGIRQMVERDRVYTQRLVDGQWQGASMFPFPIMPATPATEHEAMEHDEYVSEVEKIIAQENEGRDIPLLFSRRKMIARVFAAGVEWERNRPGHCPPRPTFEEVGEELFAALKDKPMPDAGLKVPEADWARMMREGGNWHTCGCCKPFQFFNDLPAGISGATFCNRYIGPVNLTTGYIEPVGKGEAVEREVKCLKVKSVPPDMLELACDICHRMVSAACPSDGRETWNEFITAMKIERHSYPLTVENWQRFIRLLSAAGCSFTVEYTDGTRAEYVAGEARG